MNIGTNNTNNGTPSSCGAKKHPNVVAIGAQSKCPHEINLGKYCGQCWQDHQKLRLEVEILKYSSVWRRIKWALTDRG